MTEKEFEQYYNLYSQELFGIAYSYTRNKSDSEDIIQNVFVKMIISKKKFKSDKDLKYWLIRLTMNESIDLLRKERKENELNEPEMVYTLPDNNTSEYPDLLYYISKLEDKYRRVIILYYYNNYSNKEIAELLGIKEDNVRKLLERGRNLLKERIGEE